MRKAKHVIVDIHYGDDGPSWLVCSDGTRLDAQTPDALHAAFLGHGGKYSAGVIGPKMDTPVIPCSEPHYGPPAPSAQRVYGGSVDA